MFGNTEEYVFDAEKDLQSIAEALHLQAIIELKRGNAVGAVEAAHQGK